MHGRDDLDSLLDGPGEVTEDHEAEAQSAPEPTQEPSETAPETGEKQPAEAGPPPAQNQQTDDSPLVPRAAVLDERRKRQDVEKRLQELEAELAKRQQPQQQEPEPEVDWIADPQEAAAAMQRTFDVQMYQTRVAIAEEMMRERHSDYDEITELFAAAAGQDERLKEAVLRHPNPAKYAYDVGRQMKLMQEIGSDPDAYRSKLEAEILAKHGLTAGGEKQPAQANPAPASNVPRSLARDVSAQPRASNGRFTTDDGPMPLEDLIG